MDIRQYLNSKGIEWTEKQRPSGLVAVSRCPICKDKEKSFAVSLVDGAFSCFRLNNCGVKGSWWDLQKLFGDNPQRLDSDAYIHRTPINYEKPKVKSQKNNEVIKWLQGRGIWESISAQYKIGQYEDEIMFPYFKNKEIVNVKYRSMKEKKFRQEKNAEPVLFGRDFCNKDYIILCEGEIDTLSFAQYGFDSVSVPSGASDLRWLEHEWDFLNKFQKIYICMDNDEAGQKNVDEIVKRLGEWRCYNIVLPFKDMNECLMNDIGDKELQQVIDNAKNFDPPALLKANDFEDEINYMFEHPEKMYGLATPWNGLTELLKGWREGELTVWTGRSSAGKSTLLNDVIYTLLKKGEKVIVASLEMMPKKYLRWMLTHIKQKKDLNREEVKEGLSELVNLFIINIISNINSSELFDLFNFAARKYGVKHFIIDSLMKVNLVGYDKYEEQKEFCNYLIDKIGKVYGGHIHLVAHPRKGFKDTDRPEKVDVSGSGDIVNLADNVLTLYRLTEEEKKKNRNDGNDTADSVLYLKKNREWGLEGSINFWFDNNTKTFSEI